MHLVVNLIATDDASGTLGHGSPATSGFAVEQQVPVAGGALYAHRWVETGPTVLAIHGITATHRGWSEVADRLPGISLLAPDLRGRGASADLPGPYGFAAHVADLAALLDATGCERVVVAGHSMGGFVAVALAALHPKRVSHLVLLDGGLPLGKPGDPAPEGGIDAVLGPAAARLSMTFPTRESYRDYWRAHPSIGPIWSPAVEAYIDYDLVGEPPKLHSSCREAAMRVDGAEVADHVTTTAMLSRVQAPITFLQAQRGLLNEPAPFYPDALVKPWLDRDPAITASMVDDTNHYSLVLGAGGAAAVAGAIAEAVGAGDGG